MTRSAGELLILHEDEIPDLDETVAVGIGTAGRAPGDVGTVVVEDLRARAARAGVAHGPEIVGASDAQDLVRREDRRSSSTTRRLVVVHIDGDQQALLRQGEVLGEQLPGERDGVLLEIIAEGEIAEHLEEGVVARGEADIVEIVMLAAGAHAFLRRGGAQGDRLLLAGEHVLERHHAGIGEHQGGVVARHQGRGRHHRMVALGEEIEKGRADVVGARARLGVRGRGRLPVFALLDFAALMLLDFAALMGAESGTLGSRARDASRRPPP